MPERHQEGTFSGRASRALQRAWGALQPALGYAQSGLRLGIGLLRPLAAAGAAADRRARAWLRGQMPALVTGGLVVAVLLGPLLSSAFLALQIGEDGTILHVALTHYLMVTDQPVSPARPARSRLAVRPDARAGDWRHCHVNDAPASLHIVLPFSLMKTLKRSSSVPLHLQVNSNREWLCFT